MRIWIFVCCLALVPSVLSARTYDSMPELPQAFPAPGVLIVNYNAPITVSPATASADGFARIGVESVDRIHRKYHVRAVEPLFPAVSNPRVMIRAKGMERIARITFPDTTDLAAIKAELSADPHVTSVDYAMVQPVLAVPNDPSFGLQWGLQDPQDNDVDAPDAWDVEPGDSVIILGDTDTGVQYDHPDLGGPSPFTDGNIYINWAEYNGITGVDDDGNGFIDDIRGWDFVDVGGVWPGEDGTVPDNDPMDFNGHGTHVAGIMAAMTNNGVGVAGMAGGFYPGVRGCKIMPLRIGWSQAAPGGYEAGYVRMDFAAQAFNYGVMMGVKAFNCSWESSGDAALRVATDNAIANGVTICVAAGNGNTTTSGYLQNRSDVINVASTKSDDRRSSFSNYGERVDVAAPGSGIYSTYSAHGSPSYTYLSGTSMATPMVTGLVGLVRSRNPELEWARVDSIIIHTTDNIDALNPGFEGLLGSGRINAATAVTATPIADFSVDVRFGQRPLAVQFTDHSYLNPTTWNWNLGNGGTPSVPDPATVYSDAGLYTVSLTTESDAGTQTTTRTDLIRVLADSLGGAAEEAVINHDLVVPLRAAISVPVDSLVFPFEATGTSAFTLDTVTLDGDLAAYFTSAQLENFLLGTGKGMLVFRSDTGAVTLPFGDLARLHFSLGVGIPGEELVVDTTASFPTDYAVYTPYGAYGPDVLPTVARVAPYLQGDVSIDGTITSQDAVQLVGYVFKSSPLPYPDLGDVDGSGTITSGDIIYLINFLFKSGPPPVG